MIKALKARIVAFALMLTILVGVVISATPMSALAASSENNYSQTNVFDDLRSSTIKGAPFDITDYPYNSKDTIRVIHFSEYCYSYRENMNDNYGLYVYIYNPQGLDLSESNKSNKIQMAVSYDSAGNPSNYFKYSLEYCSKSEGDYKNLFYKFKVIDKEVNGTTFYDRVNSNGRRYDVSGVELVTKGSSTAIEYSVFGTYVFSGYAAGYGPDTNAKKSTLTCDIEYLETIELGVKHTFYRSQTSSLGAGHQNQLDTVYFSVPKRYLERYGTLQKIKAEWYEYKTNEIVVTSNSSFYNAALPYVGTYMGDLNDYGMYPYVKDVGYSLGLGAGKLGDMNVAKWGWNLGEGYLHPACQRLCYLFYVNNIEGYDPYADTVSIGGVQSNVLYEWIKNYNKSYSKGTLPIKDGTISADLFKDDIDESRKMNNSSGVIKNGYSYYDFDADVDLQTLQSWSSTSPSFWDNWTQFGLGAAFSGGPEEESITVPPIQILKSSDLDGTDEEIAKRLLINVADVSSIKNEYNNVITVSGAGDEEKVVVMFRFATSDYYSEAIDIIEPNSGFLWSDKHTEGQAYLATESVFFDFDIIQLTFNKEGEYTVIPVVSNPIDIVNDITPPVDNNEGLSWWRIILAVLLVVLLLVLCYPIIPYIIQGILWAFTLPVKVVKTIVKTIKKSKRLNDKEE